jgi:hypothetical protein
MLVQNFLIATAPRHRALCTARQGDPVSCGIHWPSPKFPTHLAQTHLKRNELVFVHLRGDSVVHFTPTAMQEVAIHGVKRAFR